MTANTPRMGLDRPEIVFTALRVIEGTLHDDIRVISRAISDLGSKFNLSEVERVEVTLLGVAGLAVEFLKTIPGNEAKLKEWLVASEVEAIGLPSMDDVLSDQAEAARVAAEVDAAEETPDDQIENDGPAD
ncbi:hypothetical protein [Homoserinimonas sp. OAct 916]|uniref:hypothetical protein n=1 Tax=Homoserinimonas sp. OAct 916 TaxID=2211450 RepID=UPI000DBE5C4A|nr:hypothetical protein [Homoserinimonas sp. OAct 916]